MKIVDFTIDIEGTGEYVDVDLDLNTAFALNYSASELSNPTTSVNTYSDQISIPRTRHNNDIFGQIWDVRSTFNRFNPNRKANFRLHINNNIFQVGYIKMEDITSTDYKIRLYGNLGNLFSYLSTINVADLNLPGYEHNINVNTAANPTDNYGYGLTYQGDYDNFDNSQVDIGTEVVPVTWKKSQANEYAVNGLNENERQSFGTSEFSGEYRSYYQRPAVKLSPIIEAIVAKAEEEGYDLDITDDFFESDNPYYNDTWVMSNIKPPGDIESGYSYSVSEFGDTGGIPNGVGITDNQAGTWNSTTPIPDASYIGENVSVRPAITSSIVVPAGGIISANLNLRMIATYYAGTDNQRQHLGKRHKLTVSMRILDASSGAVLFEGSEQPGSTTNGISYASYQSNIRAKRASTVKNQYFGMYNFAYDDLTKSDEVPDGGTVWKQAANYSNGSATDRTVIIELFVRGNTYWDRQNQNGSNHKGTREMGVAFRIAEGSSIVVTAGTPSDDDNDNDGRTDSLRQYKDLINNEITCADFLLSYTKLFGLMYKVNPATGLIEVKQRINFFDDEILDWTGIVDRSSEYTIQPTQLSFRKGVFKYNSLGTKYEEEYRANTADATAADGRDYGSYTAVTGYELGEEEFNYLEGTVFDNCIVATDTDKYFQGRGSGFSDNKQLPHFEDQSRSKVDINGLVLLFKGSDQTINRSVRYTDDTDIMRSNGTICWNDSNSNRLEKSSIPGFFRTATFNGEEYSLNFAQLRTAYSESEAAAREKPNIGIVPRYWRSYLSDKLGEQSKILNCYVALRPTDVTGDLLSKFIYLDQSLWVIQELKSYNPLSAQPTKVTLVKVLDKENYLSYTNITDEFSISYAGNVIYDNTTGELPQTIILSEADTSVLLTIESSVKWTASSGLTISSTSGGVGTSNTTVNLPTGTDSGAVTFVYNGNRVTINIVRQVLRTVTATTVNGTAAYINGLASPQQVSVGRTVTFSSTGDRLFLYWLINGVEYATATPTVVITGNTTAVAYYSAPGTIALYCDDPYTTVTGVSKTGSYFLLNVGQTYTFNNSQSNFSGFLFSGDTTYTGTGPHTITEDDTVLQVYYDMVLINATVNNLSPLYDFTGDHIYLEGYNSLDFDLEPLESSISLYTTIPGDSFTFDKAPYHYPTFSQTDFPDAGIYDVTIDGNRVGWDGDASVDVGTGIQQLEEAFYSPIEFTLTSGLQISPRSGSGDTLISITATGNGGTVVGTVGGFEYALVINQEFSIPEIGWTEDRLTVLQVSVNYNDTIYSDTFYYDGQEYTLSEGLTVFNDNGSSFLATATFGANDTAEAKTLNFYITVLGQAYQLIITQAANDNAADGIPIGTVWMWYNISSVPSKWAICNGQTVNGITTPNMSGMFPRGITSGTAGTPGGADYVALSVNNLPTHSHLLSEASISTGLATTKSLIACNTGELTNRVMDLGGSSNYAIQSGRNDGDEYGYVQNDPQGWSISGSTGSTGGGASFSVVPQYIGLYFIMKVEA